MARIARSDDPVYLTKGLPFLFRMRLLNPDQTPVNLTGANVSCVLKWVGAVKPVSVEMVAATDGRFTLSADQTATERLPLGDLAELVVTIADSLGQIRKAVYPVTGETP